MASDLVKQSTASRPAFDSQDDEEELLKRYARELGPAPQRPSFTDRLKETWPAKAASEAIDFVDLFGKTYRGEIDPMSDEGIEKVFSGAANAAGRGVASNVAKAALGKGAQAGGAVELGIFAGPGAKTANLEDLEVAKKLVAMGESPELARKETGWFQAPDGKWRFEIDDSKAKFTEGAGIGNMPARTQLDHPELYEAYPDLRFTNMRYDANPGEGWSKKPGPGNLYGEVNVEDPFTKSVGGEWAVNQGVGPGDPLSVLLHEFQHQVQAREGFTGGYNPKLVLRQVEELGPATPKNRALIEAFKALPKSEREAIEYNLYRRNLGEAEANAVQARIPMDKHGRKGWNPLDDYAEDLNTLIVPKKDINEY